MARRLVTFTPDALMLTPSGVTFTLCSENSADSTQIRVMTATAASMRGTPTHSWLKVKGTP